MSKATTYTCKYVFSTFKDKTINKLERLSGIIRAQSVKKQINCIAIVKRFRNGFKYVKTYLAEEEDINSNHVRFVQKNVIRGNSLKSYQNVETYM